VPDLGVTLESVQPNREEGSQIKSVDFFQIAPFEDVLTHVSKMRDGSGRPKTVKKDIVADDGPTQPVPHSTLYSVSSRGSAKFQPGLLQILQLSISNTHRTIAKLLAPRSTPYIIREPRWRQSFKPLQKFDFRAKSIVPIESTSPPSS